MEKRYPGTAQWLSSPLWRLADKAPMEMNDVRGVYLDLPEWCGQYFIDERKPRGLFWRRLIHAKELESLYQADRLEALIALLTLVKESEIAQDQLQYIVGFRAALANLQAPNLRLSLGETTLRELAEYLQERWLASGLLGSP